jgi:ferrous iron transport protein B
VTTPATREARRPALLEKPCCADDAHEVPVEDSAPTVALVGNPNVGKSTLFNALTGARQHVGNWPGKTVSVARGVWRRGAAGEVAVVDLPGTYSLVPESPDEELTRELLVDAPPGERPELVVAALDASNLTRNLYLAAQIADTGVPVVVALTMVDVARSRGLDVDPEALARALGVPVVPVVPRSGQGIDVLADAVATALTHRHSADPADLGALLERAVAAVSAQLDPDPSVRWRALAFLEGASVADPVERPALAATVRREASSLAGSEDQDPVTRGLPRSRRGGSGPGTAALPSPDPAGDGDADLAEAQGLPAHRERDHRRHRHRCVAVVLHPGRRPRDVRAGGAVRVGVRHGVARGRAGVRAGRVR